MSARHRGVWFDGRSAQSRIAALRIEADGRAIVDTSDGTVLYDGRVGELQVEEGFDHAPRTVRVKVDDRIATFEAEAGSGLAADLAAHVDRRTLVQRMQGSWPNVLTALVAVIGVVAFLYLRGIPWAAERVVDFVSIETERPLGEAVLGQLDRTHFAPSKTPEARQDALRAHFIEAAATAGYDGPLRLEFRAGRADTPKINAFTLPGGIVVMLDGMVEFAKHDEELLAVLGHELGHVEYRHSSRQLAQVLGASVLSTFLFGDVSALASGAATLAGVLPYSRAFEHQADAYALMFMRQNDFELEHMRALFERLDKREPADPRFDFARTHPTTPERIERIERAIRSEE